MARPITWNDVAAPDFRSSLVASQAAGNSIANALQGVGQAATKFRDDTREEATREAVAGIMNSADPMAAAKAAPQGWQVDPLAIQQAVAAQDQRNRANVAADASLSASRVSTAANQAVLDDRVAEREASTMSSPMIDQIMKTNKLPSIDLNNPEWKTAAGNRAYKQVLDFWGQHQRNAEDASLRHLQKKALLDSQAEKDFLGYARDFGASVAGQSADPAEWDRVLTAEAKRRGVSPAIVDQGLQFAERGATSNTATNEELNSLAPNTDISYRGARGILIRREQDLKEQKNAALAAPIDANNPNSPSLLQLDELAKSNTFKNDSSVAAQLSKVAGMDLSEAQSRIRHIQSKYPNLLASQAADIALDTQDRWDTWINNPGSAPEAVAKAGFYKELNKFGSEGVTSEIAKKSAKFDVGLAKLPVLNRQLTGATRGGNDIPSAIIDFRDSYDAEDAKVKLDADTKAKAEAAAAAIRRSQTGTASSYPTTTTTLPRSIYNLGQ